MTPEETAEIEKIDYEMSKKDQLRYEGFLGSGALNLMDNENIEIKAGFCEEVVETISSFWNQLIKTVQETKTPSRP